MNKIKLGNSDFEITPIVFGAWAIGGWMWGGNDDRDAIDALYKSIDQGVTTIDTAPAYGFGHSEELIGKVINEIGRDKLQILTKFGLRWDTKEGEAYFETTTADGNPVTLHKYAGRNGIMKEIEDSLKRLKTDYIDLYQIHWHDKTTPISETMEAVTILKEQGKIRNIGVCNYRVENLSEAMKSTSIVSNQVSYSMVNRAIEDDLIPYCLEKGNGILAYSPLQRGLLTGKITPNYAFNKGDHRPQTKFFQPPNLSRINDFLSAIKPIAEGYSASLSQLVLNWTLCQPGISAVLAGARNAQQVADNAGTLDFTLSVEDIALINDGLNKLVIYDV